MKKVHSNFNVNAEDCSLLKNDDSSEAMISAMENGFNLYYKSKGESTLDIVFNKVEHLKNKNFGFFIFRDKSIIGD